MALGYGEQTAELCTPKRMIMKRWWIIIGGVFLFACGNNKKDVEPTTLDTLNQAAIIKKQDSVLTNEVAKEWLKGELRVPMVRWSNLELENFWDDETLAEQPFTLTKEFLKNYSSVLRWAPDSSAILDIGSYGSVVVEKENGTTVLEGGEPDTEISVIFPQTNKKARLLFAGPASYIINATWLSNAEAIIAGTFNAEGNQQRDTLLWLVDVQQKRFRLYNYKQQR